MAKLPNAERAVVDIAKLRDYALNPDHDEGAHKARVFRAALGLTAADAERLRRMVIEAARTEEAVIGRLLPHGQLYVVDFSAQGLRGAVIIRTAWIVERETDYPRLVTCYIK